MTVFLCRNAASDAARQLVLADDHTHAAELFAEATGIHPGHTMDVAWQTPLGDNSGVVLVAFGGTVFGSEDGYLFTPPAGTPWVIHESAEPADQSEAK